MIKSLSEIAVSFIAGTLGQGGAERQLYYILKTLRQCSCQVSVITLIRDQYWEKPINDLGIPVLFAGEKKERILRLKSIVIFLKRKTPTIIQSQHFYTNIYAATAGRILGISNIGAIRSNGSYEVKKTGSILGRLSLYLPQYLAANSLAGRQYAIQSGVPSKRTRLLPNVIDTATFHPSLEQGTNRQIRILMVSNLWYPEKRVDFFIKALGYLYNQAKLPVFGTIVGDGPLLPYLQKLASDLDLFPGILEFIGLQNQMPEIYRQADIVVLPSDREGTPNTLMEAMATGLPVVATRVGGIPDLVHDGKSGFLITRGDLTQFVEALSALIINTDLRKTMGNCGREYIMAKHSLEHLPVILYDLYNSIL